MSGPFKIKLTDAGHKAVTMFNSDCDLKHAIDAKSAGLFENVFLIKQSDAFQELLASETPKGEMTAISCGGF